jgi:peptidoglycan-associated lipoprotein
VILAMGAGVACKSPEAAPKEQKPVVQPGPTPEQIAKDQADQDAARKKAADEAEAARQAKAAAEAAAMQKAADQARMDEAILGKDVNFDFDKCDIRDKDKPQLNAVADLLKKYGDMKLSLQGHCDERGTVEYNLALGDKRAVAAKSYLVSLGVAEGRLSTISFGKEHPKVEGHDEQSWEINRRCEFKKQ